MKAREGRGQKEPATSKSVRFAAVVAACGEPVNATLWTSPEQDPGFSRAMREHRVMTVKRGREGSKRDFGLVGFWPGAGASFLVFPRSLERFAHQKVIGIKYELTRGGGPVGALVHSEDVNPPPRRRPVQQYTGRLEPRSQRLRQQVVAPAREPEEAKPRVKRFKVTLTFTGVMEVTREVEAESASQARARVLQQVETPNVFSGGVKRKVRKVEPVG